MYATPEGTKRLADDADLAHVGYTTLGRTGLTVSRIGFGSYRVEASAPAHREALRAALLQGVNLIDTSSNYGGGASEEVIGEVAQELFRAEKLSREGLVVISKAGYLQGAALALARELEAEGRPFPETVHVQDDLWHCLHPAFLDEQLEGSLTRLRLDALDGYLLHNPEYFLTDARKHRTNAPLATVREQLYGRIKRAFAALEAACDRGKLAFYGVSSNVFAAPDSDPDATSLPRMLELAREVAKERSGDAQAHRLRLVQLPLNLIESRAARSSPEGPSFLSFAAQHGIAVLANRPLNAMQRDRIVRLAEPPAPPEAAPLAERADEVRAIEEIFAQDFGARIRVEGGPSVREMFRWGQELADAPTKLSGLDHWAALQAQVIGPQVNGLLSQLGRGFSGDPAFAAWAKRYLEALQGLLTSVTAALLEKARAETLSRKKTLEGALPETWHSASLSRQAIGAVLSAEGVSGVLVGMRARAYVDDALGAVALPPLSAAALEKSFEVFAR